MACGHKVEVINDRMAARELVNTPYLDKLKRTKTFLILHYAVYSYGHPKQSAAFITAVLNQVYN